MLTAADCNSDPLLLRVPLLMLLEETQAAEDYILSVQARGLPQCSHSMTVVHIQEHEC